MSRLEAVNKGSHGQFRMRVGRIPQSTILKLRYSMVEVNVLGSTTESRKYVEETSSASSGVAIFSEDHVVIYMYGGIWRIWCTPTFSD